ncbi:MAG: hypothetical protein ACI35R_06760 [Bacillus sp. (in: firmicutes)]
MVETRNMIGSGDLGNSTTKLMIENDTIKQPSVIKRIFSKPAATELETAKNVANLFEQLVVHITSPALKRDGLFLVGSRANAQADADNMNIKLGNKHKHDIPVVMSLGLTAAYAVRKSYEEAKELPASLSINMKYTSAIPASEYNITKAQFLEHRFLDNEHVVIVYVGDRPVTVTINYEKVKVTQEGVPALYALIDSSADILDEYAELYGKESKTASFSKLNTFHVDIGDGTTEYIYMQGMNPVNDACSGERRGVGHATEEAIGMLQEELHGNLAGINRQQFMDMVRDSGHRLHKEAAKCLKEARYSQAQRILEDIIEKYQTKTNGNVDAIIVYGGGSIEFKDDMYEDLLDFAKEVRCEVLWIPAAYAVDMNVRGMDTLNKKVLYKG